MAQTQQINIGTGFYESDALPFANQRCVNLYPVEPQAPTLTENALFGTQGIEEIARVSSLAKDKNRGAHVFNEVPYFVNGTALYRLDRDVGFNFAEDFNLVRIGNIDGDDFVSFADNGRQLLIISDGVGYIYEPTASPQFKAIEDAGFYANGTPEKVVFISSYFVVTTSDKKAIVSAPNDGTDWNALDSFTAEADPDKIVAPFVFENQLYILGSITTEAYQLIGGAGVPFQRINGFVLTYGCVAPESIEVTGEGVFWLGRGEKEQPSIYYFAGSKPQRISTKAIDNKLHGLSPESLERVYSWSYSLRGGHFIAFTASDFTFVFDVRTGKWHERRSLVRNSAGTTIDQRCRVKAVVLAYNKIIATDDFDGRIGEVLFDSYMEYDQPLISYFTTSPLYNMGMSFSMPKIELLCENAVGNDEVPDPVVTLEISRDGVEFEFPRTRKLGKKGERKVRQIWYKNGRVSRYCIMRFRIADAVKRRLFGVEFTYKGGTRNA